MKRNAVWVLTGLLILGAPTVVGALATVESRTGDPVVYSEEPTARSSRHSSALPSAPAEDRAALLGLKHVETLKQEISELRGLVETQDHEIQQLKKSQQDFYTDLDKRISQLQSAPAVATAAKATAKPVAKTTTTAIKPIATPTKAPAAVIITPEEEEVVSTELPPAAKLDPMAEKAAYDAAYQFVKTKHYPEATAAFQHYLTQYKDGEYAANAHYWMGEVYMVEWQKDQQNKALLDKAAHAFSNIGAQFPGNAKVPDALLKLGIVENEKGNPTAARKYFMDVKSRYPGSAAARIAETRLKQLST